MGTYTGKFEDLFEENEEDTDVDDIYADEESKYWIHRTRIPTLYFNTNFQENGCPMIITEQELDDYFNQGKKIISCVSIEIFYSDEESKKQVLEKLNKSGLNQDDFELNLKNKITAIMQSYLLNGLYMPDVYGNDLERTAHQYSVKRMKRIMCRHNFGFNNYRGEINIGIILEIPLEKRNEVLEKLPSPIEYDTEYYGPTKISKVVSPKYIKGIVAKYGDEVLYIKNSNYGKKTIYEENDDNKLQEQYLYHTEELFEMAAQEFMSSKLRNPERVLLYIDRIQEIKKGFIKEAVKIPGFSGSERYINVHEYLKTIPNIKPFIPDKEKGDVINMILSKRYYDNIASELTKTFSNSNISKKYN